MERERETERERQRQRGSHNSRRDQQNKKVVYADEAR